MPSGSAVRASLLILVVTPLLLGWVGVTHQPAPAGREGGELGWPQQHRRVDTTAELSRGPPRQRIPRVLHQFWNGQTVPAKLRVYVDTWRTRNPTWQFRMWNDTEGAALIRENYSWFNKYMPDFKS
eukprot:COSAG01_NODE_30076_length_623_cov_1.469466_1_plen_125_part_10